jgi:homoserine dehydrogenase
MVNKQRRIGLFGFAVVSEGIDRLLQETLSLNAPSVLVTTRAEDILTDAAINFVVEWIDNREEAFRVILQR